MKTKVARDNCIACGNCNAICPDIYDYDEDGIAYCHIDNNQMTEDIDEEFRSLVLEAQNNCPTEAIIVED
ncbi:ferredoxin [Gemella morbillorum]|jgi:ferredoxin|uniref:ferredoxin n=1 Tax=Gemella morbillorum TaxID=29391 RepID=UPI0028CFFF78|nr:ferredoxin [Gemella morbillorum]